VSYGQEFQSWKSREMTESFHRKHNCFLPFFIVL